MAKKKSNKAFIISVLVILVLVIASVAYYALNKESLTSVQIEKVSTRVITQTVSAIGKIQPETEVKISSEASGEIIALPVKEGMFVNRGMLLAKIQPDLVDAQVEQFKATVNSAKIGIEIAKVEVDRAQAELQRSMELYKKEILSKQEFETIKSTYERAQGNLNSAINEKTRAEASLRQIYVSASRTTLYAPMSGTITKLDVEHGEKVVGTAQMQGTEMMRISDLNVMNAIVDVDENDVVKIHIGDTTRVKIDAFPDKVFNGYVYEISHSPKQKGIGTQDEVINFEVKVRLLDKEAALRPGMSCSVQIETETHPNVIAVPLAAVTIRSEENSASTNAGNKPQIEQVDEQKGKSKDKPDQVVFVFDGAKVAKRAVTTGISDKGYIEVKSGLTGKETIVSGSFNTVSKVLQDGMKVSVDTAKKKSFKISL